MAGFWLVSFVSFLQKEAEAQIGKTSFASQESHRKVLAKGVPDDVTTGIKNVEV